MGDYNQRFSISGLETLTINVEVAGLYTLAGKLVIPRLSQTDATDPNFNTNYPSDVVTTIQQNSSTIFTSKAGADGFSIKVSCAVGDTITVALSSTQSTGQPDQIVNAVRCVVSMG